MLLLSLIITLFFELSGLQMSRCLPPINIQAIIMVWLESHILDVLVLSGQIRIEECDFTTVRMPTSAHAGGHRN